jgi:hypothetical protein
MIFETVYGGFLITFDNEPDTQAMQKVDDQITWQMLLQSRQPNKMNWTEYDKQFFLHNFINVEPAPMKIYVKKINIAGEYGLAALCRTETDVVRVDLAFHRGSINLMNIYKSLRDERFLEDATGGPECILSMKRRRAELLDEIWQEKLRAMFRNKLF